MFRHEIQSKSRWIGFDCVRFGHGIAGCIRLTDRVAQMYFCAEARRQMIPRIALPDLAHGDSSGSVAYLKDARLERSLECRRREGKNELLFQAYAYPSLRADGLSSRHDQRFASGTSTKRSAATMLARNCLDHDRLGAPSSSMSPEHAVSNR
jgi:hypothetical protein